MIAGEKAVEVTVFKIKRAFSSLQQIDLISQVQGVTVLSADLETQIEMDIVGHLEVMGHGVVAS